MSFSLDQPLVNVLRLIPLIRRLSLAFFLVMAAPLPISANVLRIGVSGNPPFVEQRVKACITRASALKSGSRWPQR